MMINVLMWFLLILFGLFAIAFAVSALLFIGGAIIHLRNDLERTVIYGMCSIIMAILCAGSVFLTLMMWRDIT